MVHQRFLAPVTLPTGIQRSISPICTPLRTDGAGHPQEESRVHQRPDPASEDGQIQDASQTARHGVLRYSGLIAITTPTVEELNTAIERAAVQVSGETRRLVGQQAVAFTAAALPLARRI